MGRKKYILVTTIIFDVCIVIIWGLGVFLGPNLYSYDQVSFIFSCIGVLIIGGGNHILTWLVLKYINSIELSGEYVVFTNIKGKTFTYHKNDVESILMMDVGYRIKVKGKVFRAYYNQDDIVIIIDGEMRDGIFPGDFPNAIYDIE